MSIRDDFFTALSNGAKWEVGVSIERKNPLPIDANSVFKSLEDLNTYLSGPIAYVGQPVAVVTETDTTLYVLDQDKVPQPVGKATEGDGKTIDLTEGILGLHDFGKFYYRYVAAVGNEGDENYVAAHYEKTAVDATHPWNAGLIPQVVADGKGSWEIGWYEPNPTTIEGINNQVSALQSTVSSNTSRIETLESDVEDLENTVNEKIANIGSIFNVVGAVDSYDDFIKNYPASNYDVGDVFLVEGVKEYVCIAENGTQRWEVLGDPSGVTALQAVVGKEAVDEEAATGLIKDIRTAQSDITNIKSINATQDSKITALESKDTELANAIAEKASQAALNSAIADISIHTTAIQALESEDANIKSTLETKAATTYVDNKLTEVNGKIDLKADKDVVDGLVNTSATKDELTNGLAGKVDLTTYNSKMAELAEADTVNQNAIAAVKQTADKAATDIGTINTTLAGKADQNTVNGIDTRLGKAEATISEHTGLINGINGSISSLTQDKADKSALEALAGRVTTNEGAISSHETAYQTLLGRVNGHDTAIGAAQADATKALGDAATAASAAAEAQAAAEAAQAKAEEVLGTKADTIDDNTVYGAKAAAAEAARLAGVAQGEVDALETVVSNLDAAYKSADAELQADIDRIDEVIKGVQGAMHFAGVSSTDPLEKEIQINGEETVEIYKVIIDNEIYIGSKGDVVTYGSKEYVCITEGFTIEGTDIISSGIWTELGDVTAEAQRIEALENYNNNTVVPLVAEMPTIKADIAGNKSALEALAAKVTANEADIAGNKSALETLTTKVTANEGAIAKEITDRENAIKAETEARESALAAEASTREAAVSGLQGQIDTVIAKLTWTKIGE